MVILYMAGVQNSSSAWIAVVFGGLVWILVASSKIPYPPLQAWLMFVSVFCFVITTCLFMFYMCGFQGSLSLLTGLDVFYHIFAAMLYLSAAVMEASVTHWFFFNPNSELYKFNISTSVFAFLATFLYTVHAIVSIHRWKSAS
ncbi:myelin and lymphocyte protein-like isoform X2 [Stegostoma tigrinum]|uniref:myelin and lymphocyte protein-like isoform X2 n=1 Tax=Stegostoma tigrinum TaxID=3053191 RepID=UPI0028705737|nr:myelin and lymphocyte protein-like isoform X2 [Stegostoma tigrinum]